MNPALAILWIGLGVIGLGGALFGACLLLVIFGWRTLSRRQV